MVKRLYTIWFFNKGYLNAQGENFIIRILTKLFYDKDTYDKCFIEDFHRMIRDFSNDKN